uniref:Uncharacterized protein n=1 Tax=Lygus hesperus TaxID=30085 RepID=A0A0K8TAE9_LYGHE
MARRFYSFLEFHRSFGGLAFLMLRESPKYLLTKGLHEETVETLKYAYSVNSGHNKEDFPVKQSVILDGNETESKSEGSFIKILWTQTLSLFRKPLLTKTVMSLHITGWIEWSVQYYLPLGSSTCDTDDQLRNRKPRIWSDFLSNY